MALPKEVVKDICDFTDNVYELKAQCRDRCAMLQEDTLDFEKMNALFSERDYELRQEMYQLRRENEEMYQLRRENKMLKQYEYQVIRMNDQQNEFWDEIHQLRDYNTRLVMEKTELDEENKSLKRKINEMSK